MNKLKKYLPSKNFVTILLFIFIILIFIFLIKETISLVKKNKNSSASEGPIQITIGEVAQKDSNNNGIADWEEILWGLNPNKNGKENAEFIESKKKSLMEAGEIIPDNSKEITDNDILSRQFLATIISLQQTGELNNESIKSVSEALGKNIEATPILDLYNSKMLKIIPDSKTSTSEYDKNFTNLVKKYMDSDIGSELTFIIQGLSNNDSQALYVATMVAQSYQSFGEELIKIPVPQSLISIHLSMANNYEKTGRSIKELSKMLFDPIAGMKALLNYKKYSDALVSDLETLSGILQ